MHSEYVACISTREDIIALLDDFTPTWRSSTISNLLELYWHGEGKNIELLSGNSKKLAPTVFIKKSTIRIKVVEEICADRSLQVAYALICSLVGSYKLLVHLSNNDSSIADSCPQPMKETDPNVEASRILLTLLPV